MTITEKYIIMCDDIRREDNGKLVIIGMYMDTIQVPALPFPLPTLTFLSVLSCDRPGQFRFSFKLKQEEGGTQPLAEGMGQAPVNDPRQPLVMPIKMVGLQINAPGLYTFSLEFDGQEPIVSTFNVVLTVPGTGQGGVPRNLR
jgi:hypothetical protein